MKHIFMVTHGDRTSLPDPGMTERGMREVAALRGLLPDNPSVVVVGTGQRHLDVMTALRLGVGLYPVRFTSVVGSPDTLIKSGILLANGTVVDTEIFTGVEDMIPAAQALVADLPDNAVICCGRPFGIMLGHPETKSAAVYKLLVEGTTLVGLEELTLAPAAAQG